MIKNLLQEAIDSIELSGHSTKDVDWVGTRDGNFFQYLGRFC